MKPTAFPQSNLRLLPPAGVSREDCVDLDVYADGTYCISRWEPSDAERVAIAAGEPVWLWVHSGRTQPPVALTTEDPWAAGGGIIDPGERPTP